MNFIEYTKTYNPDIYDAIYFMYNDRFISVIQEAINEYIEFIKVKQLDKNAENIKPETLSAHNDACKYREYENITPAHNDYCKYCEYENTTKCKLKADKSCYKEIIMPF